MAQVRTVEPPRIYLVYIPAKKKAAAGAYADNGTFSPGLKSITPGKVDFRFEYSEETFLLPGLGPSFAVSF
jgi:hypothetical protein